MHVTSASSKFKGYFSLPREKFAEIFLYNLEKAFTDFQMAEKLLKKNWINLRAYDVMTSVKKFQISKK